MKKFNLNIKKGKNAILSSFLKQATFGMIVLVFLCSTSLAIRSQPKSWNQNSNTYNVDQTPTLLENDSLVFQTKGPGTSIGEDIINEKEIIVYPNPSSGMFQIAYSSDQQHIEILNSIGSLVYKVNCSTRTQTINLIDYPNGIYYIRVVDKNNRHKTLTINKE